MDKHTLIRAALGLSEDQALRSRELEFTTLATETGHGKTSDLLLTSLLQLVSMDLDPQPVEALLAEAETPQSHVYISQAYPGILLVTCTEAPQILAPTSKTDESLVRLHDSGAWMVDTRTAELLVCCSTPDQPLVLETSPSNSAQLLIHQAEQSGADLSQWTVPPPDIGAPPAIVDLLEGVTCLSSVLEHVQELDESNWALHQFAARGTLHRLWKPDSAEELRSLMAQRQLPPIERIRSWANSLSANAIGDIMHMLTIEIDTIDDLLEQSGDLETEAEERALAYQLAVHRDAIESTLSVLDHAPQSASQEMRRAIQQLDDRAVVLWSQLPPAGILDDCDWLGEVAVSRPDAWWAVWALA